MTVYRERSSARTRAPVTNRRKNLECSHDDLFGGFRFISTTTDARATIRVHTTATDNLRVAEDDSCPPLDTLSRTKRERW